MRHVFFAVNFGLSLFMLYCFVYNVAIPESPYAFCGAILFFPPAVAFAVAEWIWVPAIGLLLAGPAWLGLRETDSRLRSLSRALAIWATVFTEAVLACLVLVMLLD